MVNVVNRLPFVLKCRLSDLKLVIQDLHHFPSKHILLHMNQTSQAPICISIIVWIKIIELSQQLLFLFAEIFTIHQLNILHDFIMLNPLHFLIVFAFYFLIESYDQFFSLKRQQLKVLIMILI